MKKILFILNLLCACFYAEAQITFQKTYGGTGTDWFSNVKQTADGGYIIAGSTDSYGAGNLDAYLIKTDANGDTMWTKTFGSTNRDEANAVQQTTDGGFIIAGSHTPVPGIWGDVYLIKTDANGDSLWTRTFSGTDQDNAFSVEQTTDGGYIIGGFISSGGFGNGVFLLKTDSNGDSLWTKAFSGNFANSVKQTTDGGYILTGPATVGNQDVYLIKTDANGNALWSKTFNGSGNDVGNSVQQTSDGGYIIAAQTDSLGNTPPHVYVIKTDVNGNTLWTKIFSGTGTEAGNSVQQTSDGGYIIAGLTTSFGAGGSDVYLIKLDSNGNLLWAKTFGSTLYEVGRSVQQTSDGGYIITGYVDNFGTGYDIYLVKTDSLGNSGCNEGGTATIVTLPPTQVTSPTPIVVSPPTIVSSPPAVIGSGGTVTTLCTSVGINHPGSYRHPIAISPNPSSGNFTITFPENFQKGTIEIYNVMVEKVYTHKIINRESCIVHCELKPGIYFVKVQDGKKEDVEKLVIQ